MKLFRNIFFALAATVLTCAVLQAQEKNLLLNPGFEEAMRDVPKSWYYIGSVDYYRNRSLTKNPGAGETDPEFPPPFSGNNYIGLRSFDDAGEVAVGRLDQPLRKDQWYKIGCYVLRPTADCNQPVAGISVVLSDTVAKSNLWYGYYGKNPYISLSTDGKSGRMITDFAWTKVFAYYQAKGGERFLWLGDFSSARPEVVDGAKATKGAMSLHCVYQYYYDDIFVTPSLDPEATSVILRDITFDAGSTTITAMNDPQMQALLTLLLDYPDYKVEVNGHTDSDGTESFNLQLSANRAKAVKSWLSSQGIAGSRITAKGQGETQPCAPNDSPEQKALNRRVELKIIRS